MLILIYNAIVVLSKHHHHTALFISLFVPPRLLTGEHGIIITTKKVCHWTLSQNSVLFQNSIMADGYIQKIAVVSIALFFPFLINIYIDISLILSHTQTHTHTNKHI